MKKSEQHFQDSTSSATMSYCRSLQILQIWRQSRNIPTSASKMSTLSSFKMSQTYQRETNNYRLWRWKSRNRHQAAKKVVLSLKRATTTLATIIHEGLKKMMPIKGKRSPRRASEILWTWLLNTLMTLNAISFMEYKLLNQRKSNLLEVRKLSKSEDWEQRAGWKLWRNTWCMPSSKRSKMLTINTMMTSRRRVIETHGCWTILLKLLPSWTKSRGLRAQKWLWMTFARRTHSQWKTTSL